MIFKLLHNFQKDEVTAYWFNSRDKYFKIVFIFYLFRKAEQKLHEREQQMAEFRQQLHTADQENLTLTQQLTEKVTSSFFLFYFVNCDYDEYNTFITFYEILL